MSDVISIRPTEEIERRLDKLSELEHIERTALVKKLILKGAQEELKEQALGLFRDRKVSIGKAAEIAGISVYEMLGLIKQKGLALHITKEDIEEDFLAATKKKS